MSPTTRSLLLYLSSGPTPTILLATPHLSSIAGSTRQTTLKNQWVLTHLDLKTTSRATMPWTWTRTRIPPSLQPGPLTTPSRSLMGYLFMNHLTVVQIVTRRGSPNMIGCLHLITTPQPSSGSHYPPLHEDLQMGGPSNPVSEVDSAPVAPPLGFGNPIPAYAGSAAYNPFEQPVHTNYNYAEVDPYQAAWDYNALHPEGPYGAPWGVGYPAYGYQQPPPPQPPHQQPPQPQLIPPEHQQEVLDRLSQVEREVQAERRNNQGFFKGLASLIKGTTKRRDF
ncbi:hypothetical protein HanIR_Chr02g0064121 [Helianthus annuus]|nr:hypothetical protein HanIR_Chr02g0064121 [Helianthus annuus]